MDHHGDLNLTSAMSVSSRKWFFKVLLNFAQRKWPWSEVAAIWYIDIYVEWYVYHYIYIFGDMFVSYKQSLWYKDNKWSAYQKMTTSKLSLPGLRRGLRSWKREVDSGEGHKSIHTYLPRQNGRMAPAKNSGTKRSQKAPRRPLVEHIYVMSFLHMLMYFIHVWHMFSS
jgi:hypothetical protein